MHHDTANTPIIPVSFEKVPYEEFEKSVIAVQDPLDSGRISSDKIRECYEKIKIPKRATLGSVGYDMSLPYNWPIRYDPSKFLPTGLRVKLCPPYFLAIFDRSSNTKKGIALTTSSFIIDPDYYYANNYGQIHLSLCTTREHTTYNLKGGENIAQGIFMPYAFMQDEEIPTTQRKSGMGSTVE